MMEQRFFSLAEAQALIPVVRQLLTEIQTLKSDLDKGSAVLDALLVMSGGNGSMARDVAEARAAVRESVSALEGRMEELTQTGAELKGIDEGLIDFPSEREGRVVYLCWKLGEDAIEWWHELGDGFAGRQRL